MYISVGAAAEILGVSISTLRRWEKEKVLLPSYRTMGGHRRYDTVKLMDTFSIQDLPKPVERRALAYARVSGADQRSDLETQKKRLEA
ncbi:MAG: recombinase family protein, partial [Oligoflexus sp.]|nr:recombinase family protein [Oligoflexus sp.]